jgi:hypothetical protein
MKMISAASFPHPSGYMRPVRRRPRKAKLGTKGAEPDESRLERVEGLVADTVAVVPKSALAS